MRNAHGPEEIASLTDLPASHTLHRSDCVCSMLGGWMQEVSLPLEVGNAAAHSSPGGFLLLHKGGSCGRMKGVSPSIVVLCTCRA